jgi:hypothetical protein
VLRIVTRFRKPDELERGPTGQANKGLEQAEP